MSYPNGIIAKHRILYNNIANDTAFTVSATTEATSFDKEYAIDNIPRNTWRSTAITQTYLTFDGTTARTIAGCYITNHNITGGTPTFNLETSDDDFSSTDTTTAFTTVTRTQLELENGIITEVSYNDAYCFVDTSAQDFRISMVQTATNTYHEIGNVYLFSTEFVSPKSYRWNATRGPESVFSQTSGQYGQQNDFFQFERHVENFVLPAIPVGNLSQIGQIGANPTVIYMPDGLNGKHWLGRVRFGPPVEVFGGQHFEIPGTFEEAK